MKNEFAIPNSPDAELICQALMGLGHRPFAKVMQGGRLLYSCFRLSTPEFLSSELRWILGKEVDLEQFRVVSQ